MTDKDFVAEHIMEFKRGHCQGKLGGADVGQDSSETWFWCDWCGDRILNGATKPSPEYPFPDFSVINLMRRMGAEGIPLIVRFDTIRKRDGFTIIGPGGRICDTDTPLESLCEYLAREYNR